VKIEGYFRSIKDAKKAEDALKNANCKNVYIDMNEHNPNNMDPRANAPGTENGASLSALTLGSGEEVIEDFGKTPLMASSPMASGMAGFEEIANTDCRITAEVEKSSIQGVRKIIEENNGTLENPFINPQKAVKDMDIESVQKKLDR
jgi:hypothetical protein